MKHVLFMLILFVSLSQVGLAQEEKPKDFGNAFDESGGELGSYKKNFLSSSKTGNQIRKSLDSKLRPLFKKAFETKLKSFIKSAQEDAGKVDFEDDVFEIKPVENEIGEYLAKDIRPKLPEYYKSAKNNLVYKFRDTMSIEKAIDTSASLAADSVMIIFNKTVNNYIQKVKSDWVKTPEKSNLDKAADAAKEKDFMKAIDLVKEARDNGEIGNEKVGQCAMSYAEKALEFRKFKDAAKLADIAYDHGTSIDLVNQLKYQIYDQAYESAKEADDRRKARQLRKVRNDYRKWKP